jgi:hypothetical protein
MFFIFCPVKCNRKLKLRKSLIKLAQAKACGYQNMSRFLKVFLKYDTSIVSREYL